MVTGELDEGVTAVLSCSGRAGGTDVSWTDGGRYGTDCEPSMPRSRLVEVMAYGSLKVTVITDGGGGIFKARDSENEHIAFQRYSGFILAIRMFAMPDAPLQSSLLLK